MVKGKPPIQTIGIIMKSATNALITLFIIIHHHNFYYYYIIKYRIIQEKEKRFLSNLPLLPTYLQLEFHIPYLENQQQHVLRHLQYILLV